MSRPPFKPIEEYQNPEDMLPSTDRFYKTNRIFNGLFKKEIVLKEGKTSSTNINGYITVNFNQVEIRTVVSEYDVNEYLLSCNHTSAVRVGGEQLEIGQEIPCYRCGSLSAYRHFEHEWSHIIFKSAPGLYSNFVDNYAQYFGKPEVHTLLTHIVNAFDDVRVNSLWQLVYPGSAGEIEQKWKEQCELDDVEVNTNFIAWLFGVATKAKNLGKGPFKDLIPLAEKALDAVKGRGAMNMLLVVRWFLERVIDRLINEDDEDKGKENEEDDKGEKTSAQESAKGREEKSRDQAIEQIMTNLHDFRREQEHHVIDKSNYVSRIAYRVQPEEQAGLAKILTHKLSPQETPDFQPEDKEGGGEIGEALKTLQKSSEEGTTLAQYLLSDVQDKVFLAEVPADFILPNCHINISQEDEEHIQRMRAVFAKFIGKKISRLIDDGNEIDVQALIQYRLDGQDDEIFEDEGLTKGFAYLTLCDMSQSMEGAPFSAVSTGSEMLKQALKYPFVKSHLWGFRGAIGEGSQTYVTQKEKLMSLTKGGEVWIYKYDAECRGYIAKQVEAFGFGTNQSTTIPVCCGGMTPTPAGIHTATKYLSSHIPAGMEKKIFLLTDGNPTQIKAGGDVPRERLLMMVRKEVNIARSKGIQIYTVILGDEITDKDALDMFGSRAYWRRVPPVQIGQALLEIVLREFVRFLRR